MKSGGRLTHRRKCRRLWLMRTHGTSRWSLTLKHKLPRGRYRVTASGLDKKGNREHQHHGNTINLRVR